MRPGSFRVALAICAAVFGSWIYLGRDRMFVGANNFAQLYAGARYAGTAELYSPELPPVYLCLLAARPTAPQPRWHRSWCWPWRCSTG